MLIEVVSVRGKKQLSVILAMVMKKSVTNIKNKYVKTQENLQSACPLRSNTGPMCVRISEDRQ